jgi:DNA-binding transcriptional LysR family regulator
MSTPDFNLLLTLDAVLTEGSVVRAAARLHLSPSAMSRALARLRETTGDPLLVKAGRGLVPTPRALELCAQVRLLVEQARTVLRPAATLDPALLARSFTLRTRDGFVDNFGAALIDRIGALAPGVQLRFVQKPSKDGGALRDGTVDLETGVLGRSGNTELCSEPLFADRFIGVVRQDHALSKGKLSAQRYAQGRHIGLAMHDDHSAIDEALNAQGLTRNIATVVGGFATALALARSTDLIASVPERHTGTLREGMHSFALPLAAPEFGLSLLWHPRLDADPAHRWLRAQVLASCR